MKNWFVSFKLWLLSKIQALWPKKSDSLHYVTKLVEAEPPSCCDAEACDEPCAPTLSIVVKKKKKKKKKR